MNLVFTAGKTGLLWKRRATSWTPQPQAMESTASTWSMVRRQLLDIFGIALPFERDLPGSRKACRLS